MPAAKSMSVRREIVGRRESGEGLASIARALKVSYSMVRKLWKGYRQTGQLVPGYERCGHTGVRKGQALYEQAIALKAAHPGWGAGLIRVELGSQAAEARLPSSRTLQRWFRRAGVGRVRPETQAKASPQRGQEAHEVWAMDAKEQIRLADGSYVSWLTITDEGSGAIVEAQLFPPAALDKC